ncbi:BglII/BstYI family type II restriction endonuclease [Ruegeria meonggei]|uniref:Restriction endonuclease BglII n=1 Tax=Ruegeria meonggei TaxID=1446476 RepID=A0A1X6ZLT0_9RHOB|nr:BglII/BstYI family type II restriction endonuclease [Ruegeria meonggei]SLN55468.1 Restriction endonuclease BglII [Ruegeria meonggei]
MSDKSGLIQLKEAGWEIQSINFADVIIREEFYTELEELAQILTVSQFSIEDSIIKRGGGLADQTQELTAALNDKDWWKNNITVSNTIEFQGQFEPIVSSSTSHEIDHLKKNASGQLIALEIEWNNKDEFFDRDFQSIRRLYELNVIDLGIIITRSQHLEDGLLQMISHYFEKWGIQKLEDFSKLHRHFTDHQGRDKFSFPTNAQAKAILAAERHPEKSFAQASAEVFKVNKFGGTTTNWRQLQKRVQRRDAGRTPMLFLGMPQSMFV